MTSQRLPFELLLPAGIAICSREPGPWRRDGDLGPDAFPWLALGWVPPPRGGKVIHQREPATGLGVCADVLAYRHARGLVPDLGPQCRLIRVQRNGKLFPA